MPEFTERELRIADQNKDISTEQIKKDILDTQREIVEHTRKAQGYRMVGDRMAIFRADGLEAGIESRKKFIADLESILKVRGEK